MLEAGRKMLSDSIVVGRDFARQMVTLSSGAIPIYVALVGLAYPRDAATPVLFLPPTLFLLAVLTFAWSALPKHGVVSLDVIEDIARARDEAIKVSSRGLWTGFAIFSLAIASAIFVVTARSPRPTAPYRVAIASALFPRDSSLAFVRGQLATFEDSLRSLGQARSASYQQVDTKNGKLLVALVEVQRQ